MYRSYSELTFCKVEVKVSQESRAGEPEPLEEKKTGAGAGAAKKLAGSSALR